MILKELNKRPKISFGLGKTKLTIQLGQSVTIFQNEIFNTDLFTIRFQGLAKNTYSFNYTPNQTGEFMLEVEAVNKLKNSVKKSNKIKLIVQ